MLLNENHLSPFGFGILSCYSWFWKIILLFKTFRQVLHVGTKNTVTETLVQGPYYIVDLVGDLFLGKCNFEWSTIQHLKRLSDMSGDYRLHMTV